MLFLVVLLGAIDLVKAVTVADCVAGEFFCCVRRARTYTDSYGFCQSCPDASDNEVGRNACARNLTGHVMAAKNNCSSILTCGRAHCCILFPPCLCKVKRWGDGFQGQIGNMSRYDVGGAQDSIGDDMQFLPYEKVRHVCCRGKNSFFFNNGGRGIGHQSIGSRKVWNAIER